MCTWGVALFFIFILKTNILYRQSQIGYEPADLTVHPPPKTVEGGFIFFV